MDHGCSHCSRFHPSHLTCEEALEMEEENILIQENLISPVGQVLHENDNNDTSMENDNDNAENEARNEPGPGIDGVWDPLYQRDDDGHDSDEESVERPAESASTARKLSKKEQRAAELREIEDSWSRSTIEPLPDRADPLEMIPESSAPKATEPANVPRDVKLPLQFFRLFFCDNILNLIVDNTNNYGQDRIGDNWKIFTVKELLLFIALILYMGITWQPDYKSYWNTEGDDGVMFGRAFVRRIMSRDRFIQLFRCLHFTNVVGLSSEERAERSRDHSFWMVAEFLALLAANCMRYVIVGRFLSIDEMCIWFKGRHRSRCYNPNKPEKWHLKAFCLNCALSGYYIFFRMYEGKDEEREDDVAATVFPVKKLLENERFHHKNIIVATDNWYTSIPQLLLLLSWGIHLIGTIRTNKAGLPKKGILKEKDGERGNTIVHEKTFEVDKKGSKHKIKAWFVGWYDNKVVHLLTSIKPYISCK